MIGTLKRLTSAPGIIILIVVVCCFDINEQRLPDALTYISVLPNIARGSRCDTVSQLHGASYVTLLSVITWPYRLSSRSLCGRRGELFAFFFFFFFSFFLHFTLTIDHFFGESCHGDSNAYSARAGPQSRVTAGTGRRGPTPAACAMRGFQEPYAKYSVRKAAI